MAAAESYMTMSRWADRVPALATLPYKPEKGLKLRSRLVCIQSIPPSPFSPGFKVNMVIAVRT